MVRDEELSQSGSLAALLTSSINQSYFGTIHDNEFVLSFPLAMNVCVFPYGVNMAVQQWIVVIRLPNGVSQSQDILREDQRY